MTGPTDRCGCGWEGSWDGAVCPECGADTQPIPCGKSGPADHASASKSCEITTEGEQVSESEEKICRPCGRPLEPGQRTYCKACWHQEDPVGTDQTFGDPEPKPEPAKISVGLRNPGRRVVGVIKVIREHLGINLRDAKNLVDRWPVIIPGGTREMIDDLIDVGADAGEVQDPPSPGSRWKHYKGGIYKVLAVAKTHRTQTQVVVYEPDGGGPTMTRHLTEWADRVDRGDYRGPRFVFVDDGDENGEVGCLS